MLLLHLIITHLVNTVYDNYVINKCPRQLLWLMYKVLNNYISIHNPYASLSEIIQCHSSRSMNNTVMTLLDDYIRNCKFLWQNDQVVFFFIQIWSSQSPTNPYRVQINVSCFKKFNTFLIFHDTISSTYPENHNTKITFCFLNQGTKTNLFLALRLKKCCCCLDIRFLILI